jgi:hypothetical protein
MSVCVAALPPQAPVSPFKLIRWVSRATLSPAQLRVAVWLIDHGYQGRFNGGIGAICKGLGLRDRSWVRELIRQISTKLCGGLQVLHFPGRANLYVFDQTQLLLFNQHANLKPRSQMAVKPDRSAPAPRSEVQFDRGSSYKKTAARTRFEELFDRSVAGALRIFQNRADRRDSGWLSGDARRSLSGTDRSRSSPSPSPIQESQLSANSWRPAGDRNGKIDDTSPPRRL